MPSTANPLAWRRSTALLLRILAALVLALCWHWLVVFAAFPIGGADFHWVFQRPSGGDSGAAYVAALVYAASALAFLFFLFSSRGKWGAWIVGAVLLGATLFSLVMVMWNPDPEDFLAIPIFGGCLSVVAWLLWRVGRALRPPVTLLLAGLPGTWSLWEMYSFPYASSPSFRGTILPIVILYPLVFAIASLAWWRRKGPAPRRAAGQAMPHRCE